MHYLNLCNLISTSSRIKHLAQNTKGQKFEKIRRDEDHEGERRERSIDGGTQKNSRKERERHGFQRRTGETLRLRVMQQAVAMVM